MKDIEFFKLEDRVLFEAAAAAEIVAAADAAAGQESFEQDTDSAEQYIAADALVNAPVNGNTYDGTDAVDPDQLTDVDSELNALISGVIPGSADVPAESVSAVVLDNGKTISTDRELVIIDSSVKDVSCITGQLRNDQDVLILQDNNGLTEVNEYLREHAERYSAVHIVTHGDNDGIFINGEIVTLQRFDAAEWADFNQYLTADGDILFYGCNIAENSSGQALIGQIAEASGADVAASTDMTGFSGNWDLEFSAGTVETAAITVQGYEHDLAETIVSSYSELKDALEAAATNGNDVTIVISSDINIDATDGGIYLYIENDLNLTIRGIDDTIDILGCENDYIFRFFDDADCDITITIDNLNFNGQNYNTTTAVHAGGVEELTVSNSKFENFTGSAIIQEIWGDAEELIIENSEFLNNNADGFNGGAVSTSGVSVTISNSYFSGNSSTLDGGALHIEEAPALTISNSTFYNNSAFGHGGAADIIVGDGGKVTIDNSTFYQNSTDTNNPGNNGGALSFEQSSSSTVTISNSTFANNSVEVDGKGSAVYSQGGTTTLVNSLFIGEGSSVVANDGSGNMSMSYSFATSVEGNVTVCEGAEVSSDFTHSSVFGSNSYNADTHTIAVDAFHKAAWSGTKTGSGLDQLGVNRETINTTTGLTGKYTIGALTAAAGLRVTQGNYETFYTGSVITPEDHLTLTYADGSVMTNSVSATLTSNPATIQAPGEYTITPSDAVVDGIDAAKNVVYSYVAGTLTVKQWGEFTITGTTFNSTYGDTLDLTSSYTITTTDQLTGNDISLTVTVEWQIDGTVITAGDYNASGYLNFKDGGYANSLTVKDFTVTDANGKDMKDFYIWNESTRSSIDIAKRAITVTADSQAVTYNGVNQTLTGGTVTTGSLVAGDTLDVTGSVSGRNAGKYTYTLDADGITITNTTGDAEGNYDITFATGKLTINKANLTLQVNDQGDVVYGTAITPGYTAIGLFTAGGDAVNNVMYNISGATSTSGNYIVGEHGITITNYTVEDGNGGNNYIVRLDGDTFNVNKLDVTVSIDGSQFNKVYDGTTDTEAEDNNYTINGLIDGDQVTADGTFAYDNRHVGNDKTVTMSGITLSGADADNYNLLNTSASADGASIDPAPITNHIYCEGLFPGHFSVVPSMWADLLIGNSSRYGDFYTMPYSELVSKTMLDYNWQEHYQIANDYRIGKVNVDTLNYHPFTIDAPAREISDSIIEYSVLINETALYSGEELFVDSVEQDDVQLFQWRGDTLSDHHEPIFLEEGSYEANDTVSGYVLQAQTVDVSGKIFVKDETLEADFNNVSLLDERQISKAENLKSSLEKLLDKLCLS